MMTGPLVAYNVSEFPPDDVILVAANAEVAGLMQAIEHTPCWIYPGGCGHAGAAPCWAHPRHARDLSLISVARAIRGIAGPGRQI